MFLIRMKGFVLEKFIKSRSLTSVVLGCQKFGKTKIPFGHNEKIHVQQHDDLKMVPTALDVQVTTFDLLFTCFNLCGVSRMEGRNLVDTQSVTTPNAITAARWKKDSDYICGLELNASSAAALWVWTTQDAKVQADHRYGPA